MNSTFSFNDKKQALLLRIKTCLALPSTTNSTNSNSCDLDSVSPDPQNNGKPIDR